MKNLILLVIILLLYKSSYSCSCIGTIGKQSAKRIFAGEVIKITSDDRYAYVTFKIHNRLKGLTFKRITIKTPLHSASCGFNFGLNGIYIVYTGDRKFVSNCSRTKPIYDYSTTSVSLEDDMVAPGWKS